MLASKLHEKYIRDVCKLADTFEEGVFYGMVAEFARPSENDASEPDPEDVMFTANITLVYRKDELTKEATKQIISKEKEILEQTAKN